jgi:hypothetical protein
MIPLVQTRHAHAPVECSALRTVTHRSYVREATPRFDRYMIGRNNANVPDNSCGVFCIFEGEAHYHRFTPIAQRVYCDGRRRATSMPQRRRPQGTCHIFCTSAVFFHLSAAYTDPIERPIAPNLQHPASVVLEHHGIFACATYRTFTMAFSIPAVYTEGANTKRRAHPTAQSDARRRYMR